MKFFSNTQTALKICGVKTLEDAEQLVSLSVDAVGFNFWPESKRYLAPSNAQWMKSLVGKILRVGVFVNEAGDLPYDLVRAGMIDVVQLHGDESPEIALKFSRAGIPVIKALGIKSAEDLDEAGKFETDAVLLDAHAPKVFGGTGETFDWNLALQFKQKFPNRPMVLAGGITPENAVSAVNEVNPAAIDVASGAEISPGVKDFNKVKKLLEACGKDR
ncbi:MAG: N-(5'-phosphoribosyl)anthranilate isomerase [Akkermansiaceae bacterium]